MTRQCRCDEKAAQSALCGKPYAPPNSRESRCAASERADRFKAIGRPKSEVGERTVPIPPMLMTILREWKLACPNGELGLVFPSGAGGAESLSNILQRGLLPAMIAANLTKVTGKEKKAKYTGLHALRHFFSSWCINRRVDGGLELPSRSCKRAWGIRRSKSPPTATAPGLMMQSR
jgi:integrase